MEMKQQKEKGKYAWTYAAKRSLLIQNSRHFFFPFAFSFRFVFCLLPFFIFNPLSFCLHNHGTENIPQFLRLLTLSISFLREISWTVQKLQKILALTRLSSRGPQLHQPISFACLPNGKRSSGRQAQTIRRFVVVRPN